MVAVVGQLEPAGQREVLGQLDRVVLLPLVDQVVRRPTVWKVKRIKPLYKSCKKRMSSTLSAVRIGLGSVFVTWGWRFWCLSIGTTGDLEGRPLD